MFFLLMMSFIVTFCLQYCFFGRHFSSFVEVDVGYSYFLVSVSSGFQNQIP